MPDTPDARRLKERVFDWLDDQELDPEDRAQLDAEIQTMHFGELATTYPEVVEE